MNKTAKATSKILSILLIFAMLAVSLPFTATEAKAVTVSQNQANIIARADYMYNSTWVCQKTITSWKSQSYFYAGSTYRIPYAWPVTAGKWVGLTSYGNAVTVDQFLEATKNASSVFYTQQSYYSGNAGSYAPYYGNDCSTFVSYCWGLTSRQTTSSIVNASGVSLVGNTTTANVNSYLKVGDALNYAGSHIVLVSDIVYDASGAITSIEITEQTPPQLKRTNHTVSSLVSKYGSKYKIYRYSGNVSAPPSGAGTPSVGGGTNPDNYTVPTSALTTGASGTGVAWIQAVLNQLGYSLTVDGSYGNGTATAVAYFQMDYGLTVSGTADTTTIAKLQTLWANKLGYYSTTAGSLNMRSGAGTSYGVIATLPQNSTVAVVGFNSAGTWANVIYNGTEGWVSKSYLSFIRKFSYTANYNTNISATMSPVTFTHDRVLTVAEPPANSDGNVLRGWQLLRASDWVWYNGSSWVSDQGSAKLYQPGETITFSSSMLNSKCGDDSFYLCAVWGSPVVPDVATVTPSSVSPSKYGWQWPAAEAYGYIGNYGGNGQDIELCADLCLLPSSATSSACFYTNGTEKLLTITPTTVTMGSKSVAYNWGELSINNWHDVKFKVFNNHAYIFIDGQLIISDYGYTANESYQLLFCLTGEMAIDNVMMMSSTGTTYFNCNFEDEAAAKKLMGEGLGQRTLLFPDTSSFTVKLTPASDTITGTGDVTFTATPSAGEGHTYAWSSSNSALNSYMTKNGNTLRINIPSELANAVNATITCTVTSDGGVTQSATASFSYTPSPAPSMNSISPASNKIVSTGSVSYTATASGEGITYKWSSSNSALNSYLYGTDSATLTVNIPSELASALSSTLTCTVTNKYGKKAAHSASFSYEPTPVPVIVSVTPSYTSIEDTGKATYTVKANGDGLTYKWTSSNEELNAYLEGTDTAALTVNIPEILESDISADLTCTVTNSFGKTASMTVGFAYTTSFDGGFTVVMMGDVDGNGTVNPADTNVIRRVVSGTVTVTEEQIVSGDVNGDGLVNGKDANLISRYASGIISEF